MTSNRWIILAVLFLARLTMAFQFQSVAALSPLLIEDFGVGLADVGFLIGRYFAPGIVFALPGGVIAARIGDKRIVGFGMILMLAGGAFIATTENWNIFTAARLVVGVGGVILNVVLTKMVVDWFAEKELSTAMALIVNSWPVGIALALLVMPAIAAAGGIVSAWWAIVALTGVTLALFVVIYRAPDGVAETPTTIQKAAFPAAALVFAGLVWALYNTALAMVFSFGPAFLVQVGYTLTSAGSLTSLFMIIFSIALPVGGIIADSTGRKDAIILLGLLSFAALMPIAVIYPSSAFVLFCILGILFALGAGPVMTLPAELLSPKSRALGMGVFFSIYYAMMMVGPRIGGGFAESTGDAGTAILAGAAMSLGAAGALLGFRRVVRS